MAKYETRIVTIRGIDCIVLIYFWIEKYRDIKRQGCQFSDAFSIEIENADSESSRYVNNQGQEITYSNGAIPNIHGLDNHLYKRKINITQKQNYISNNDTIYSITSIIGKNAVGKSTILECMAIYNNHKKHIESGSYFFVFYDDLNCRIEIRSNYIEIEAEGVSLFRCEQFKTFTYFIGLNQSTSNVSQNNPVSFQYFSDNNKLDLFCRRGPSIIPTTEINIAKTTIEDIYKSSYVFIEDFKNELADMFQNISNFVVSVKDVDSRYEENYFPNKGYSQEECKLLFIYKFCYVVFMNIKHYLYENDDYPPNNPEEGEYSECLNTLCHFNRWDYPHYDSRSFIKCMVYQNKLENEINEAIDLFKKCKYPFNLKPVFDKYILSIENALNIMLTIDEKYFTAFYKLELPVEKQYFQLLSEIQSIIVEGKFFEFNNGLHFDIEWLSAGERETIKLYSLIYKALNDEEYKSFKRQNVVLMFDEPETHLHPSSADSFIEKLYKALTKFKNAGYLHSVQIIICTHSPFIIKSCLEYNHNILCVEKNNTDIAVNPIQLKNPISRQISYAEILYRYFDIVTSNFHDELYGAIYKNSKSANTKDMDDFLNSKKIPWFNKNWKPDNGKPYTRNTICTYLRNYIHHTENDLNPVLSNSDFDKYLRESIEAMDKLI